VAKFLAVSRTHLFLRRKLFLQEKPFAQFFVVLRRARFWETKKTAGKVFLAELKVLSRRRFRLHLATLQ